MKQSRFTDGQIIAILKQAESGMPVPEVCPEHSISIFRYGRVIDDQNEGAGGRERLLEEDVCRRAAQS